MVRRIRRALRERRYARHRHDRLCRASLELVDNYRTHKHAKVERWLKRHPRFHIHFIPTSSSWLNLIERWFRDLTDRQIRRGVFRSVEELIQVIVKYIEQHNEHPKPFVWTAKAEDILEKVRHARTALENVKQCEPLH